MKVSGFCALFLVVVTAFMFFNFLTPASASWFPDLVGIKCGHKTTLIAGSRKLKENGSSTIRSNNKGDAGRVTLDDYNPIDPAPAWKQVNAGPIEHGSPLIPFIPKLPPPPSPSNPGNYN